MCNPIYINISILIGSNDFFQKLKISEFGEMDSFFYELINRNDLFWLIPKNIFHLKFENCLNCF